MNIDKNKKRTIIGGSAIAGGTAIFLFAWISGLGFIPSIGYQQEAYSPADVPAGMTYFVEYAAADLSLEDMAFESQLIIQGKVIEQKEGRLKPAPDVGAMRIPTTSNIVQIDKVIKGQYNEKTINVVTEGSEKGRVIVPEAASLKKGERLVLFLYKAPEYGPDAWGIKGIDQGKYNVDAAGQKVKGKFVIEATILGFEKKIKDVLSKPRPENPSRDVRPGDKDLTTTETKAMEKKLAEEFNSELETPLQQQQEEELTPTQKRQQERQQEREQQRLEQQQQQQQNNTENNPS